MIASLRSASSLLLLLAGSTLVAQTPPDITRERADYLSWLTTSASSPLAAVAQQPLGQGLRLGPNDADIPLPGMEEHRVFAKGKATMLESPTGTRPVGRSRPIRLGGYTMYLTGSPTGTVVTVFGHNSGKRPAGYYPYQPSFVFIASLLPSQTPGKTRVLAADGIEADASEAGSVVIPLAGGTRLRVLRIPRAGDEESELEIFFQDETNGHGSYPAGRFVSLIPADGGKYRVDFNRARNPFCAYSTVYPCPAPWHGNLLRVPVTAGERYAGVGLEAPSTEPKVK